MNKHEAAWIFIEPLIKSIAGWETDHGTACALVGEEKELFLSVVQRALLNSSCRAAISCIKDY